MARLTSAKGLLALLLETDNTVLHFAITRLNSIVDEFWYEFASQLPLLDELVFSESLPTMTRQQAALLASRTHFHMGAYDDSVHYAIVAGPLFKEACAVRSDYADTMLGRCIDMYVAHRESQLQAGDTKSVIAITTVDQAPREEADLEAKDAAARKEAEGGVPLQPTQTPEFFVQLEKMFESLAAMWIESVDTVVAALPIKELVGFTLRARRADLLQKLLSKYVADTQSGEIIGFTLGVVNKYVRSITFRTTVLKCLAGLYSTGLAEVDFFALVDCLLFLDDAATVADLIRELLVKDKLVAYQIGFDLFESANQEFLAAVVKRLCGEVPVGEKKDGGELRPVEEAAATPAAGEDTNTGDEPAVAASSTPAAISALPDVCALDPYINDIILGNVTTQLYVKFLYSQCKADMAVLTTTKKVLPPFNKASALHVATIMSSSFMYCGTTNDSFLRDNLQWLGKATNWAKFSATASVGLVHRGYVSEAMTILKPYLPNRSNLGALPFQEAGALFALGLMHAGLGNASKESREAVDYLRGALRDYNSNEQMVHGAALGLGLVAMGMHDEGLFDVLYVCVNGSDAVPGEGAAIAIGLVNLGSANEKAIEMALSSCREHNQKEKVIRGLCGAIALMCIAREGLAEPTIKSMLQDRDPWVRTGGCHVIGLAYAGTGSPHAIESLLQTCVRDVSDEVRRAAVSMIGLVCLADVERCCALTRVFADSYNPHIRYGVAIALGLASAGIAHKEAVAMLWLLKDDTTDFVRQGAVLGLAMALIQQPNATHERAKEFRTFLSTKIADLRCDACTKFGCILAQGILDACGRNASLSLHRNGHASIKAVVGVFLFLQHWHWFPFSYMLSLAFQPTCILALNERLEMPEYEVRCNAPPSKFAPPPSVTQTKKETRAASSKAAVLSTTQRQADLKLKKRAADGGSAPTSPTTKTETKEIPATAAADDKKPEEEETEPEFEILKNPARMSVPQLAAVVNGHDKRHVPVKRTLTMGVCMLRDQSPDEPVKVVSVDLSKRHDDVPPPEPFEWP